MTFTHALATNNYGPAKFIVDASAANGTHTTIAAALTSASSGDTIFIRPGTYTENLTLKAGVNLCAYVAEKTAANVIISGKCTFTAAGSVNITGIVLQTNSDFALSVTGSSASIVYLTNCYINCTNNTGIQFTSSSGSAQISVDTCFLNLQTTGIAYYTQSSGGNLFFRYTSLFNDGGSTTQSSNSAGSVSFTSCGTLAPIACSSSGIIEGNWSTFNTNAVNATAITTAGTGSSSLLKCDVESGTASAISVGSGTTLVVDSCSVFSSNTNAVTGAGTISFGIIVYTGSSSKNNVTTQNSLQVQNIGQTPTAFTPGLAFGGASTGITYTSQIGLYSVVKNILYFTVQIILSSKGSATGVATITGFPVTVSSSSPASVNAMPFFQGLTLAAGATSLSCNMTGGATTGAIWQSGTGIGASQLSNTNFSGTDVFVFSGFYFI